MRVSEALRGGSADRLVGSSDEHGLHDVFVSYSRRDAAFVDRLVEALDTAGKRVWVDRTRIPPTAVWMQELMSGIDASDVFLFVITPHAVASEVCASELRHALEVEKRVAAVLREPVADSELPRGLAERQWIRFVDDEDFDGGMAQLLEALATDDKARRLHTRLLVAAVEWDARGRGRRGLLHGDELTEAIAFLARAPDRRPVPVDVQRDFVAASVAWRVRRRQLGAAIAAVLLAAAAVLIGLTVRASDRAGRERAAATSRQLAAQATAIQQREPERALNLAVRGYEARPTAEARNALVNATVASRVAARLRPARDAVNVAAFSADGRRIVTGGIDGSVVVWDWAGERPPVVLPPLPDPVSVVALDPSGRRVLSGTADALRVSDTSTARTLLNVPGARERSVNTATFSQDGSLIAMASPDAIRILDSRTGELQRELDNSLTTMSVAFSPDGEVVAGGAYSGDVRAWLWRYRRSPWVMAKKFDGIVSHVSFFPNSRAVLVGAGTQIVGWDPLKDRRVPVTDEATIGGGLNVVAPNWPYLLVAAPLEAHPTAIGFWHLNDAQRAPSLRGLLTTHEALSFSPDGRWLLSVDDDGSARVLDPVLAREIDVGYGTVDAIAFARDGRRIAVGKSGPSVMEWTGGDRATSVAQLSDGEVIRAVARAPEGAVRAIDSAGTVVDARAGSPVNVLRDGTGVSVDAAEFSRDGRRLAILEAFNPLTQESAPGIAVWDGKHPTAPELRLQGSEDAASVAMSTDGRRVAAIVGTRTIRIWPIDRAGTPVTFRVAHPVPKRLVFTGDGRHIVGDGGEDLRVWDVSSGAEVSRLRGPGRPLAFAVSPAGPFVAAADYRGDTRVWNWRTREGLILYSRDRGQVYSLAFSPDGRTLALGHIHGHLQLQPCPVCTSPGRILVEAQAKLRRLQRYEAWGRQIAERTR